MKIDKKITGWKVNASDPQLIQEISIPSDIDDTLLSSKTYKFKPFDKAHYLTITEYNNKPYSIFYNSKDTTHLEAMGVLTTCLSMLFQLNAPIEKLVRACNEMVSSGDKAYWGKNYQVERKKKNYSSIYEEIGAIIEHYNSNLNPKIASKFEELPKYIEQPVDIVREKNQDLKGSGIKFTHVCSSCGQKKAILMDGCVTCTECLYSKCS